MSTTYTVDPVNGADYYGLNATTTTKSQSTLDMEAFLKLLVVQLENQNPLEPMNDAEFYSQLAQMGTVQGIDALKESMSDTQAMSMMGKVVTAVRPTSSASSTSETITGVVKSLIIKDGERYLGIQDSDGSIVEVEMDSIQDISNNLDVTSAATLIGKTVTGAYNQGTDDLPSYVAVTGTVTAAFAEDGIVKLTIEDNSGNSYDIAADTVSNIQT
jgi:flagellar basal-body rod modification protein FlgD